MNTNLSKIAKVEVIQFLRIIFIHIDSLQTDLRLITV